MGDGVVMRKRTLRDRLFQMVWRLTRGMTLGVRVIAQCPRGRVALVRHTYVPGWHLPGGGVEKGEHCAQAAWRELAEETHATVRGPFVLKSVHANHAFFPNDHVLVYHVLVETPPDRPPCLEIAEVKWVLPDDLPDGVSPATKKRLEEMFGSRGAAPLW